MGSKGVFFVWLYVRNMRGAMLAKEGLYESHRAVNMVDGSPRAPSCGEKGMRIFQKWLVEPFQLLE